jgi:anti-sigma factor RsiW
MRCPDARRDMFAFLDGAVSVERNLEVLAHLNMCPPCGRRFEAERRFEECLCETLRAEPFPSGLSACLEAALDRAEADLAAGRSVEDAVADETPHVAPAGSARTGALRLLRGSGARRFGLSAAAAVVLVVGAAWATCTGPFQCHYIQAAVQVPERLESGQSSLCLVTNDCGALAAALCGRGASDAPIPDLAAAGFMLVGGAASVPAPAVDGAGLAVCYQSPSSRMTLVRFPTDGVLPESWNRIDRDGRAWYEASCRGRRVLGWVEGGYFHALVTSCPSADLASVASKVRM